MDTTRNFACLSLVAKLTELLVNNQLSLYIADVTMAILLRISAVLVPSLERVAPKLITSFLRLDLNRCGASMKSIWLCTHPFGACQVAVLVCNGAC